MGSLGKWFVVALAAAGGAVGAASLPGASAEVAPVNVSAVTVPSTDYSGSPSYSVMPMVAAPDGSATEWVIVNGDYSGGSGEASLLSESTNSGFPTLLHYLSDAAYQPAIKALADVDGSAWAEGDDGTWQIPADHVPDQTPQDDAYVQDMTVGPDGNLYYTDGTDTIHRFATSGPSTGNVSGLTVQAGTPAEAIASAGDKLWFSTNTNQLESITTTGSFGSPLSDDVSQQPHTLTTGANGELYAVNGGGDEILEIDSTTGKVLKTYCCSLPAEPAISSISLGPDGNIWFTESGVDQIGELDIADDTFTSFPLPPGYALPALGSGTIARGPSGSGTMFFGAQTSGGLPAIGEISNIPGSTQTTTSSTTTTVPKPPAPMIDVSSKATVSSKDIVKVAVSCKGATCSGKVTLTVTEKVKHKKKTVEIGSAAYKVNAGKIGTVSVKLNDAGKSLLKQGKGRLMATVIVKVRGGKKTTGTIKLSQAKAKKKKQ